MTHPEILEMEAKGYIGEEPRESIRCSSCDYEIILGYDNYHTEEYGYHERFYCIDCYSKRDAGEE